MAIANMMIMLKKNSFDDQCVLYQDRSSSVVGCLLSKANMIMIRSNLIMLRNEQNNRWSSSKQEHFACLNDE